MGTRIGEGDTYPDFEVFLANDERVLVYDVERLQLTEASDPETDLRTWLDEDAYVAVMHDLGLTPEIDV